MNEEPLPFALSSEARQDLLEYLTYAQKAQDRAHIPRKDLTLATLIWSFRSQVAGVEIGPTIEVGHYSAPPAEAGSYFLIDGHRVWIGEWTLELLRGRTLILQQRIVPAPINTVHCFRVDPAPDNE
jgi:hypothetical protein